MPRIKSAPPRSMNIATNISIILVQNQAAFTVAWSTDQATITYDSKALVITPSGDLTYSGLTWRGHAYATAVAEVFGLFQ